MTIGFMGWVPEKDRTKEAQAIHEVICDKLPRFNLVGAGDEPFSSKGAKEYLWTYSKQVLGQHLRCLAQLGPDCVSMGGTNACNYLSCVEIALGDPERFRFAFPPYFYGISRVQIGKRRLGTGGGSLGSWLAQGFLKYGFLPEDDPSAPKYSEKVSREWGNNGPPEAAITVATPHVIQSAVKVTTYEQVRDALSLKCPVIVCSDQGFERFETKHGRIWGIPSGNWNHCKTLIAVDDDPDHPGCYDLNSWGASAHPAPLNGEPPGGFWVDAHTIDRMVRQGDSFAFSGLNGFLKRLRVV